MRRFLSLLVILLLTLSLLAPQAAAEEGASPVKVYVGDLLRLRGCRIDGALWLCPEDICALYQSCYAGPVVRCVPCPEGMLSGNALSGRDDMEITVAGNAERILLVSRFDNLGKGASGAAIQNLNLMLGVEETAGLVI